MKPLAKQAVHWPVPVCQSCEMRMQFQEKLEKEKNNRRTVNIVIAFKASGIALKAAGRTVVTVVIARRA